MMLGDAVWCLASLGPYISVVEQASGRKMPGDFFGELVRGEDVVEDGGLAGGGRLADVSDQGE